MGNLGSSLKGDRVVRSQNIEKQIDNLLKQQSEEDLFIREANDQLDNNKLAPGTGLELWRARQRKEKLEEQIRSLRSQANSEDDAPPRPSDVHIRDGQIDWLQTLPEEAVPQINSEDLPVYSYDALKESNMIRLLILYPSLAAEDVLCCSLRSVGQTEAVSSKYEALSYTWGDPFFVHKMQLETGSISITESLDSALRALRLSDKPRVLWVDAVCIDQQNNAEKAQQLPHMSWIYASASQVVIWLGEDTDRTAKAGFEVAKELHRLTWALGLPEATSDNEDQYDEYMPKFEAKLRSIGCTQFFNILAKAWFTRTWTLQEVVLSSRAILICGQHSVEWTQLETAVNICWLGTYFLTREQSAILQIVHPCITTRTLVTSLRERTSFNMFNLKEAFDILVPSVAQFRTRGCGDDRDRIYALLSMQTLNPEMLGVRINYADTVEKVYADFTRTALQSGHTQILIRAGLWDRQSTGSSETVHKRENLPSWAFELRLAELPLLQEEIENFGTEQRTPWTLRHGHYYNPPNVISIDQTDPRRIRVKGRVIDEVRFAEFRTSQQVTPKDNWQATVAQWITLRFDTLSQICSMTAEYPVGHSQTNIEAFADAIVAGGGLQSISNGGYKTTCGTSVDLLLDTIWAGIKYDIRKQLQIRQILRATPSRKFEQLCLPFGNGIWPGTTRDEVLKYKSKAVEVYNLCSFIFTERGLMGLSAPMTTKGDIVVRLACRKWPFLLRPVKGTSDYQLIGECYLHGYMDGEENPEGRPQEEEQWFSLV